MLLKVLICCLPFAFAQIPIPKRPLGFVYNFGSANAPIDFDVYLGPLCPDSATIFPIIMKVADHYGQNTLRLRIHLFPLPYHRNSFIVAMGTHAVDQLTKSSMTYKWTQMIYNDLQNMSDVSLPQNQVIMRMASLARSMGISETAFTNLVTNVNTNEDCRIEWKYACSRGVTGTPTFMLNDVSVAADASWSVDDWSKVIDPLLKAQYGDVKTDCKVGTKRCEYLPGKIECCTKGENCIPNVGCRC